MWTSRYSERTTSHLSSSVYNLCHHHILLAIAWRNCSIGSTNYKKDGVVVVEHRATHWQLQYMTRQGYRYIHRDKVASSCVADRRSQWHQSTFVSLRLARQFFRRQWTCSRGNGNRQNNRAVNHQLDFQWLNTETYHKLLRPLGDLKTLHQQLYSDATSRFNSDIAPTIYMHQP
jgi:hypothetical protein